MPSIAFEHWSKRRSAALDEIENAHRTVGGTGPGRRYATQQINQAYAVLLSSQFQGFCRDLYTEAVDYLMAVIGNALVQDISRGNLHYACKLDSGNPNPRNIEADFDRLGRHSCPTELVDQRRTP